FIPGIGAIASISKVYGTTWAMGVTADYYFRQNREVVKEELMRMFKMTQKEKTLEKQRQMEENRIAERLQTLWDLFQKNLITQEEYNKKREEILSKL
ncbi:MAG: SHOCT domain-containing protein, partial [Nitrospira sp.]|nr:SHOCT domain-containing protein [Nitrospira sp.]